MRNLIPKINGEYIEKNEYFLLPDVLYVSDVFPISTHVFEERLQKIGAYKVCVDVQAVLSYEQDSSFAEEAYFINIEPEKIRIKASSEHGYSNALVSLYQLLAKGKGRICCGEFYDEPKYAQRGFMLDCCRHFFPIEEVKKILEQCALLKFTHFHWHLSEDQGFRIESKKFPKLNEISSYRKLHESDPLVTRGICNAGDLYGGYYTQEEIKDLIRFAADRQIEVYPEIDLPGHSMAALAAYPELSCTGDPGEVEGRFGIFERIFCAGKKETYEFLYALLDEVSDLFPSKYFHIGGDEAPKTEWKKCPDCNRMMQEQGFTDYEELQAYFTMLLIEHLKTRGKTPIVWNDAAASGNLDAAAVLQFWQEEGDEDYTSKDIQKDRKFILSEVKSFYCDYKYQLVTMERTLMYEPRIQGVPIPEKNIIGIESPMWCEYTPYAEDLEKMLNPRLLAVSENGWTRDRDYTDFLERLAIYQNCETLNFLNEWEAGETVGVAYAFE